ncbi:MAG: carbohydrate-binding protein [Myxococcales bacterium]|nr:carbohydrate-binding protein [Myxococcales bacterium]
MVAKVARLGCGSYRLTGRLATNAPGQAMHVEIGGRASATVALPYTGGWERYQDVALGDIRLPAGRHEVRFVFDTGLFNLDWVFLRRLDSSCG